MVRLKNGELYADVPVKNAVETTVDITWFKVNPSVWSTLGVATAKIPKSGCNDSMFAHVYSQGKRSVGMLSPHASFGMVVYRGSTARGFSGAPYYLGSYIYGVHLGSSALNLGVDIQYIFVLMLRNESPVDHKESTEDYAMEQIRKLGGIGRKIKYQRSPFSSEEIMVKVLGKVYVLDTSDHPDIYKYLDSSDTEGVWVQEKMAPCPETVDYVDSGNAPAASAIAGASGVMESTKSVLNGKKCARPSLASSSAYYAMLDCLS